MAGQKTISCTYAESPAVSLPRFFVTGTLIPDCSGEYFQIGVFNGLPLYERFDHLYVLKCVFLPPITWEIILIEEPIPGVWTRIFDSEFGLYLPSGEVEGEATFSSSP
jgi:hypothetical protein